MWLPITAALSALCLVLLALRHRRAYLRELPLHAWGRDFPDAEAVAVEIERTVGLPRRQHPAGLAWLGDFFLSPVWLFWGDLRSSRPERRLSRWCLTGERASGRVATIQLGPDHTTFSLSCRARGAFWAEAGAALEAQEGLRCLHPIGGSRWQAGQARLAALFTRGIGRMRLEAGALHCAVPTGESAPAPSAYAALLDELEALAVTLEARG